MSRSGRKPWEEPIIYNDDRFDDSRGPAEEIRPPNGHKAPEEEPDERDGSEVDELARRSSDDRTEPAYECNDTTPIDYSNGPHEEEFGVEDDEPDFEPLDGEPEFDDEV